jgi:nitrite reductase/ring-hydroxylating ferredoxin subunit
MNSYFCPHCGWSGKEKEVKWEEQLFCKKHNIKLDLSDVITDADGKKQFLCRWNKHIVSNKDINISEGDSMHCPKCKRNELMKVDKFVDKIETIATIEDYGQGMIFNRVVLNFGKGWHWERKKGKIDVTSLPIFPVCIPLIKDMQLKKGDKFKVTFERIEKR